MPWMMTPILRPSSAAEVKYNELHASGRNSIERLNGVLKQRWRCLNNERALRYAPTMVGKIVNVCCALHNFCLKRKVPIVEPTGTIENETNMESFSLAVAENASNEFSRAGDIIRKNIVRLNFLNQ